MYKLLTILLVIVAIYFDLALVFSIFAVLLIMEVFIFPYMDFSEEECKAVIYGTEIKHETMWKVIAITVLFVTLVSIFHQHAIKLFGQ